MAKHGVRAICPLKDATLRRIARGVVRYVLEAKQPFVVTYGQHGGGNRSGFAPHHTITASTKDQNAIVVPTLIQTGYGERPGQEPRVPGLEKPIGTMVAAGAKHALVAAFLAQHNAGPGMERNAGRPATAPLSTITTTGSQQTLVAAFLQKYCGQGLGQTADGPLHTLSTRDTFGLVTVEIDGETYAIADIGMRMLTPREQFRAQGFPDSYVIDRRPDGAPLTKTEQTRMCGNSVCPDLAAALARANGAHLIHKAEAA